MTRIICTIPVPEIGGEIAIDVDENGLFGWVVTHEAPDKSSKGTCRDGSVNRRSVSQLAAMADACLYALTKLERKETFKTVRHEPN
ncbi:hypothetical protein SPB21_22535 [Leptothoe sp. ISB3NOV94-8A]